MSVDLEHKTMRALKKSNLEWNEASNLRISQLNKIDEFRFYAYVSASMNKERMKNFLDKKILKREFQPSDWV